jgi:hypothetical protein
VAGERCTTCGTPRTGSFRYCLKCGFDFEPRPIDGAQWNPAAQRAARPAGAATGPPPILRSAQPASVEMNQPLVPVGPSTARVAVSPIPGASPVISPACPYLGLLDDPDTHFMFAAPGHRCRAGRMPVKVSLPHQETYCLSADYPTCRRFPASDRKRSNPLQTHGQEPGLPSGRGARRRLGSFLRLVLAFLLVSAAVWVIGTQQPSGRSGSRSPNTSNPMATEDANRPSSVSAAPNPDTP